MSKSAPLKPIRFSPILAAMLRAEIDEMVAENGLWDHDRIACAETAFDAIVGPYKAELMTLITLHDWDDVCAAAARA